MKKLSTNPIDQHFREVLKSPDLKYNKQDWKGLEKMLPQNSEKKKRTWWMPASVAAALVLLFTSLWILNKPITDTENASKAKQELKEGKLENSGQLPQTDRVRKESPEIKLAGKENKNGKAVETGGKFFGAKDELSLQAPVRAINLSINDPVAFKGVTSHTSLASISILKEIQSPESIYLTTKNGTPVILPDQSKKKTPAAPENGKGKLSLGLSVSPDLNSIGKFSDASFGNSFGLTASYQISPRLSVNTALAYSRKVYSALPYEYKAPWAMSNTAKYASSIDADCRVLDIPLNLQYNLRQSSKGTIFASAGISSYIMLNEKYTIDVDNNQGGYYGKSDPSYGYKNKNQHLLGVLNFSAGLAKPLNKQTSLVIEPYARLPLTGIGQGDVHLKSVGINLQLQYHLKKRVSGKTISLNVPQ